ncbi:hypothetical protein M0R45_018757 [Rubus argutus]|uniref:Sugar phosphate transporter domain-containing protein n=1 Tax=Rubus argutus TaxID=59490 RepID=A0AAW1X624_RUBAR
MLNFLVRKDVRKILKRKDSDAGERGRALEDLRSSLFNLLFGIIFMNKLVLKVVGFQFPIFLTFIHYIVSWLLMAILKSLSILPASPSKSARLSTLFTLGFVMALSTGLANVSLKYNSVGFYQMSKIAVTPSIVLAEFYSIIRECLSPRS